MSKLIAIFLGSALTFCAARVVYVDRTIGKGLNNSPLLIPQQEYREEESANNFYIALEANGIKTFIRKNNGDSEPIASPFMTLGGGLKSDFGRILSLRYGLFVGGILHNTIWFGVDTKFLANYAFYGQNYINLLSLGAGIAGVLPVGALAYYISLGFGSEFFGHSLLPNFKYFFGVQTFSLGIEYAYKF